MTNSDKLPATAEPEPQSTERASDNAAVNRCIRAWNRAYNMELAQSKNRVKADDEAQKAYYRVMPPLAGYINIRDFIACVTYASLIGVMDHSVAQHHLEAAKIAIGVVRNEPRPLSTEPKRLGRPPKSLAEEEIK